MGKIQVDDRYPSSVKVEFTYSTGSSARVDAFVPRDVVLAGRTEIIKWLLDNQQVWREEADRRDAGKTISAHSLKVLDEELVCIGAIRAHRGSFTESMSTFQEIHSESEFTVYLNDQLKDLGDIKGRLTSVLYDRDPDVRVNLSFGKPVWARTYAILLDGKPVAFANFDPALLAGIVEAKTKEVAMKIGGAVVAGERKSSDGRVR